MLICPSCNQSNFSKYKYISKHLLVRCKNCHLLVTKASKKQIESYVKAKYSREYAINYSNALPKLQKRFNYQINQVKKYKTGGKLLDIGCGTGHFLEYLKTNHKNWRISGVEPSKMLRQVARANTHGDIRDGRLDKIPYEDDHFDVITCYDVLEHNINLGANIKELRRVLKPQGILFIQAPNYLSLMAKLAGDKWDWWCVPDHILHFSYGFLTKYLTENGFIIKKRYTYEDNEDFLSNLKGVYARNYITKLVFICMIPILLMIQRLAWFFNGGGLQVFLLQKSKI